MSEFPAVSRLFEDPELLQSEANPLMRQWLDATRQLPGANNSEILAIVDGTITPTLADCVVDTEGGSDADELLTISTDNLHTGAEVRLYAADVGRVVTVMHQPGAVNGVTLLDGQDRLLSPNGYLHLKRNGDNWQEIASAVAGEAYVASAEVLSRNPRRRLTEDLTIYVRSGGDDTADGLHPENSPLATLEGARAVLAGIDPGLFSVLVDIGEGEFVGGVFGVSGYTDANLFWQGVGADTVITDAFTVPHSSVSHMSTTVSVWLSSAGVLNVRRRDAQQAYLKFIGSGNHGLSGHDGATFLFNAVIEFSGSFNVGLYATRGGKIACDADTVFRAIGNPSFSTGFAVTYRGGNTVFYTCAFEGAATGPKYVINQGGQISGQGANADLTTLLGNQPGILSIATAVAGIRGAARGSVTISSSGVASSDFGITSVTRTGVGTFQVAHNVGTPLPVVTVRGTSNGSSPARATAHISGGNIIVRTYNASNALVDDGYAVLTIF